MGGQFSSGAVFLEQFRWRPGVKPILIKVNVANITLKTVTFVIQNTKKHCRIVSHQKWATTFLFMNTGDTKNNDHINKSIKNIWYKFTISCKSIYLLEYFLGLLTGDSIVTVGYSDWKSYKQNIFKVYWNFWKQMFHTFGRFIFDSKSKYIENAPVAIYRCSKK